MSKTKRAGWFKLHLHMKPIMDAVPDEALAKGIRAALTYFECGQCPQLDPLSQVVFSALQASILEANEDYARNIENGKKGGRPRKPPVTDANAPLPCAAHIEEDGEAEEYQNPDKKRIVFSPFTPPEVGEVKAYYDSMNYRSDPHEFWDYYTANGWRMGNAPMQDWKAAARSWNRKNAKAAPQPETPQWVVGHQL